MKVTARETDGEADLTRAAGESWRLCLPREPPPLRGKEGERSTEEEGGKRGRRR